VQTLRKPRYQIEQLRIDDEGGIEMWNLDAFAAEFGHRIERVFPIFLVFIDGILTAYYYAQPQVCIYPAIHPNLITRRSYYEVGSVVVAAAKQVFGNPLWIIADDSPVKPDMLAKVGLKKIAVHAYETED
jgi:hypothetical protein